MVAVTQAEVGAAENTACTASKLRSLEAVSSEQVVGDGSAEGEMSGCGFSWPGADEGRGGEDVSDGLDDGIICDGDGTRISFEDFFDPCEALVRFTATSWTGDSVTDAIDET